MKYLVCWKGFTTKNDIWEKRGGFRECKRSSAEFKKKISVKVRQQEKV